MSEINEVCGNCQHSKLSFSDQTAECLVWNKIFFPDDTCQFFKTAECLLPTLGDIQKIYREFNRDTPASTPTPHSSPQPVPKT